MQHGAVEEPGTSRGDEADVLMRASDDPEPATKSPGAVGEEEKTWSDVLLAVPSTSQPSTSAVETTSKPSTYLVNNTPVQR